MSTAAANVSAEEPADRQDALDALFEELDLKRKAALWIFWRTLFRALGALPLSFLPGVPLVAMFSDAGTAGLWGWVVRWMQSWPLPYLPYVAFAGLGLVLVGIILIVRYYRRHALGPVRAYERDYKQRVFNAICELHFPGLRYNVDGYIGYDEFEATKLFPYPVDVYQSEDYFEGRLGQTDIRFAEVMAQRERRRLIGKPKRYYETYFDGIVLVADFHKHFHSTTRLVPEGAKLEGVRGQKPVVFEDPEFEALFEAVSTDQIDVRYILSPSMMQRFVQLSRRFPKLRAKFENENLILMLPSARDHFQTSIHQHPGCKDQINRFVRDLKMILPVVEELNLNTRIWSKS